MTNTLDTIDERTIDRDPVAQFQLWFADAVAAAGSDVAVDGEC